MEFDLRVLPELFRLIGKGVFTAVLRHFALSRDEIRGAQGFGGAAYTSFA
jgi:hypothetical protein